MEINLRAISSSIWMDWLLFGFDWRWSDPKVLRWRRRVPSGVSMTLKKQSASVRADGSIGCLARGNVRVPLRNTSGVTGLMLQFDSSALLVLSCRGILFLYPRPTEELTDPIDTIARLVKSQRRRVTRGCQAFGSSVADEFDCSTRTFESCRSLQLRPLLNCARRAFANRSRSSRSAERLRSRRLTDRKLSQSMASVFAMASTESRALWKGAPSSVSWCASRSRASSGTC